MRMDPRLLELAEKLLEVLTLEEILDYNELTETEALTVLIENGLIDEDMPHGV